MTRTNRQFAQSSSRLAEVLKQVGPMFRRVGYTRLGQNFGIESAECWAVCNFQKSRQAEHASPCFYVNVGLTAKRVEHYFGKESVKQPTYFTCAWLTRLASFASVDCPDRFSLRDEEIKQTVSSLCSIVTRDLAPALSNLLTEEDLLASPRYGFPLPQHQARVILLALRGRDAECRQEIANMLNGYANSAIPEHLASFIRELNQRFPAIGKI